MRKLFLGNLEIGFISDSGWVVLYHRTQATTIFFNDSKN